MIRVVEPTDEEILLTVFVRGMLLWSYTIFSDCVSATVTMWSY